RSGGLASSCVRPRLSPSYNSRFSRVRRLDRCKGNAMNFVRTAMLLAALTAIFMGVGYMVGGTGGMFIAFLVAASMNIFTYWNADKLVLRMHGAREVDSR